MKPTHNLVFSEKYENKDGEEKRRYTTVGKLFRREDGSVTIKLETLPISPQFNGWLSVYKIEPRDSGEKEYQQQQQEKQQPDDVVLEDIDDKPIDLSEIPF